MTWASACRLGVEGIDVADGYDPMMFARAIKTDRRAGPHPPRHAAQ